jgi:hypothetical protein
MAAFSSLAVFWRCDTSMRSPTGLDLASSNASRATVRSAVHAVCKGMQQGEAFERL